MDKFNGHSRFEPKAMTLESLKEITNNFANERELGRGTFGKVYLGLLQNGEEIAVKLLHLTPGQDDDEQSFMRELRNLWKLKHQNIVRLLGYCYEIKYELIKIPEKIVPAEKLVPAEKIYRALCFEYMHNGSLGQHLYDEFYGHDWNTRYKIIKGTCEGLKYLHEELETPMYHLDLKPGNILLDKNMVPKLADFGLSKLIYNEQTQATQSLVGTIGYLPPEYIEGNLISNKLDIFSLGVVMIRIITGYKGYSKQADMSSSQEFIDLVHENWRNRLATSGCTTLEAMYHQVKKCIEIALDCVHADRKKRPAIGDILRMLDELEQATYMSEAPSQMHRMFVADAQIHRATAGEHVRAGGVRFRCICCWRTRRGRWRQDPKQLLPEDATWAVVMVGSTMAAVGGDAAWTACGGCSRTRRGGGRGPPLRRRRWVRR